MAVQCSQRLDSLNLDFDFIFDITGLSVVAFVRFMFSLRLFLIGSECSGFYSNYLLVAFTVDCVLANSFTNIVIRFYARI